MSLNSIQRRHSWLVVPLHWLEALETPERWAAALERGATRSSRLIGFDTTALGRLLQRLLNTLSPPREWLLHRSAFLRRVDWQIRKMFWACVWCGVVATDLRPRPTPIPVLEKPIRLVPAPETYADFEAPRLVVPDDVPCAEKSLATRVGVQVIHVLQEIYPIVSTYQVEAHPDPVIRFDEAYSFLHRATRDKPRWHPDLVEASRQANLLAALGAGGPFAKLLQRVRPDADEYTINLEHLAQYGVREGLYPLGSRIEFVARGGQLVVTGIRYEGQLITPGSPRWAITERIALAGLMTHLTVWRQGMEYHVGGLAAVPILTHNYLPPEHPLRRLLAPHLTRWMTTSLHTHVTLRRRGFDVTGFAFPYDVILRYYNDGAAAFDIRHLDVELDARERGIPDSLTYPYLPQALRYYRTFGRYVGRYVDCYYPDETALAADLHARLWFEALDHQLVGRVRPYVADLTRETLVKLCTLLMYSASVAHTENSLTNYGGFMPTAVRQDGGQQSVGEVQNIVNFQLLVATPTTRLVSDHSHLALDRRGAEIMRQFVRDLLDIQREMDAEPSRYWHLHPRDIEASVSC